MEKNHKIIFESLGPIDKIIQDLTNLIEFINESKSIGIDFNDISLIQNNSKTSFKYQ
jgi:hypothetical protein